MDQATRIIGGAGLGTVSQQERRETGDLAPRNLGAAGAGEQAGIFLERLPVGTAVEARTSNHCYLIRLLSDGRAEISGHERYCPEPVLVRLRGTQWLDSSIEQCYVAPGLQLQFVDHEGVSVLTSPITSVRVVTQEG